MGPKDKCKACDHYKVLSRIIVDGKPYKSCRMGETPEYCRIELEKASYKE